MEEKEAQPKTITVLVSVKNKELTLEKCINSLIESEFDEKEILIIDNFSTDSSPEILRKFGNKIRTVKRSGGLSEIFNWALDNVDSEYIAITDADCVVDKKWIIELLKPFATEDDIVATAGYCGTPKDVSLFQKVIGLELENRYKRFSKNIKRAPTMSLCLKRSIARKVRFDEYFPYQSFEADFCYRLLTFGKIYYTPVAKVWHYHRSSIKTYFIQQKEQAKWGFILLLKHGFPVMGDNITKLGMTLQIPLMILAMLSLTVTFFVKSFILPALIVFITLLLVYLLYIVDIGSPIYLYPYFLFIFLIRNFAWVVGAFQAIALLPRPKKYA